MLTIRNNIQSEMIWMTMEDFVPQESLYRKIDEFIDFTFIYDLVKDYYSPDNGRPSLDPVVLFKLVFIQTLDGLKSMRKTCEKIKVDAEYRWFLNIPFGTDTPHFSTFSKNYERRFKNSDLFEAIFINIVHQAIDAGLVDGKTLFTDSTHKKANANKNKFEQELIETAQQRKEWLEEEINQERVNQGYKPFEPKQKKEQKIIRVSTTDPESGYYHRDHKERGFMYLDHRTVDGKCNIIVDCHITKGNVHDSQPYIQRMKWIKETFDFQVEAVALDSGYDTIEIKKYITDQDIFGVIGYRRYGTPESRKFKKQFDYVPSGDYYMNKQTGEVLKYSGLVNRQGYKTYQNNQKDLKLLRSIHEEIHEQYKANRLTPEGKLLYSQRKETVERSFADSKQNHGYRYAMVKGLQKNQHYTWLICAAQNMKNIAIKRDKLIKRHQN